MLFSNKYKMKKEVIGDGGVVERMDMISHITIAASTLLIIILVFLSIMAYVG